MKDISAERLRIAPEFSRYIYLLPYAVSKRYAETCEVALVKAYSHSTYLLCVVPCCGLSTAGNM
jgi:hypothetical protein